LALRLTEAYQLTHQEGKVNLHLKIVHTWQECGSLRETARRLSISRNTVRKWVRRYRKQGEAGLVDRSRRPHTSPRRTPKEVEEKVLSLTGLGQKTYRPRLGATGGNGQAHLEASSWGRGKKEEKAQHVLPGSPPRGGRRPPSRLSPRDDLAL